jgi:hypothetical protein
LHAAGPFPILTPFHSQEQGIDAMRAYRVHDSAERCKYAENDPATISGPCTNRAGFGPLGSPLATWLSGLRAMEQPFVCAGVAVATNVLSSCLTSVHVQDRSGLGSTSVAWTVLIIMASGEVAVGADSGVAARPLWRRPVRLSGMASG